MTYHGELAGRTILVLEDEPIIALDLEMTLSDAGAHVLGPVGDEWKAIEKIDMIHAQANGSLSAAVLDVHLGRGTCEPVADHLRSLGVPFVFHTGNIHDSDEFVRQSGAPVVRKPALPDALIDALKTVLD